jgi:hypothetical protein
MVNLAVGQIWLPMQALLQIGSLVRLPGGTILSHVAWQSTLEIDLLEGWHSAGAGLLDEKHVVHSA